MKFLYILSIFIFFISCGDDNGEKKDPKSCDPACESWEYCEEGECILTEGNCYSNEDCGCEKICDLDTHICKDRPDPCDNIECPENSYCELGNCICNEGYHFEGDTCISDNPCEGVSCGDSSHCEEGSCVCDNGYHFEGENCVIDDLCEGVNCQNNAHCEEGSCVCDDDYHFEGDICVIDDPCEGVNCQNNAHCEEGSCVCDNGYHFEGENCISDDPCENVQCPEHSFCEEGSCICDDGYHFEGEICIIDDLCEGVSCQNNTHCEEGSCVCDNGYHFEGDICVIDPFNEDDYLPCPDDMVAVQRVCIDKYEASKSDATDITYGDDQSIAVSAPNKLPWFFNPIDGDKVEIFRDSCEAAGKRLCRSEEWTLFCETEEGNLYSFGNQFDREICNCVDTFCDDYCLENNISSEECNTGSNCGYQYYCFDIRPTGYFEQCTNSYGAFDINGNVWEIVDSETDPRGFEVRGGAFNCGGPSTRLQCTYNAGWSSLYAGFRCCKDRERVE